MITGQEAWDFLKSKPKFIKGKYTLPEGYACYYRITQYSEWFPATFNWYMHRNYYYEGNINTGKHSGEVCLEIFYPNSKNPCISFLWELNKFHFNEIGIDYVDAGANI